MDDQYRIRGAVAEILIFISSDRCTDEKLAEIRKFVEDAAKVTRSEEAVA